MPEHRQSQLLIFALGGAARRLFDGMTTHEKQYGAELDDGNGRVVRVSVVEFILGVLESQLPVHGEAKLFIISFDLFTCMLRRDERPED